MGSLYELEYFLHLANRLNYLSENDYKELQKKCIETIKCLRGFMKSLVTKNPEIKA